MTSVFMSESPSKMFSVSLTSILLFSAEEFLNLVANFTVGKLHVILGRAIIAHKREEVVISDVKLSRSS